MTASTPTTTLTMGDPTISAKPVWTIGSDTGTGDEHDNEHDGHCHELTATVDTDNGTWGIQQAEPPRTGPLTLRVRNRPVTTRVSKRMSERKQGYRAWFSGCMAWWARR
jgi:hypothetical protein